jgi:hypothetical protein
MPDQPPVPSDSALDAPPLHARPVVMSRVGWACAAVVLVVFTVTAVVMPRYNAGATFGVKDQVATGIIGFILAGLFVMPSRPRVHADSEAVRLRNFLGGWRVVPWDLIVRVEFPRQVRFARLVLPGEEILAIYAIPRLDGERAVESMRRLRALHAAARPPE